MALYIGNKKPTSMFYKNKEVKAVCLGGTQLYDIHKKSPSIEGSSGGNEYIFENKGYNRVKVTIDCYVSGTITNPEVYVSGTFYVSDRFTSIPPIIQDSVLDSKTLDRFKPTTSSRRGTLSTIIEFPYSVDEVPNIHVYTSLRVQSAKVFENMNSDVTLSYDVTYEAYYEAVTGDGPEVTENTAVLGKAIVGKMILGKGE